ncbi:MAG: proline racemase family protein [Bacteroidota bacterium]
MPLHTIKTIDMHTGGEPLRVILEGYPEIKGNTILAKRQYLKDHLDHFRTALMHEPRGHADMYGCLIVEPNDDEADFGIIFLHNEGYSTMCGHAIIAIGTLAVKLGWVPLTGPETTIKIDAPCGRITAFVKHEGNKAKSVRFHCVPSFLLAKDTVVDIPELGMVKCDIAYGGAFYAYVQAKDLGLTLDQTQYRLLIERGMQIKHAVMNSELGINHPFEADLSFLYGTIFIDDSPTPGIDSRNVCIFADGEVDRCPTGSGVSGRMAIHHLREELPFGESMKIESITGSVFSGKVVETTTYGDYPAVIPEVEGQAFITGRHEFIIDEEDPFAYGFFLR